MYQDFYAGSNLLIWPLIGLMIFIAVFAGVLAYTFFGLRDGNKLRDLAALPLADDDTVTDGQAEGRAS
jgi:hypothetical protein